MVTLFRHIRSSWSFIVFGLSWCSWSFVLFGSGRSRCCCFVLISCRKAHYGRPGFIVRGLMEDAADDPFPSGAEGQCLALKHGQTCCDRPRAATLVGGIRQEPTGSLAVTESGHR